MWVDGDGGVLELQFSTGSQDSLTEKMTVEQRPEESREGLSGSGERALGQREGKLQMS